jgi:hypothetical protein
VDGNRQITSAAKAKDASCVALFNNINHITSGMFSPCFFCNKAANII